LGKGIVELIFGIYRHKQAGADGSRKTREKMKTTLLEILKTEVMTHFVERIEKEGQWDTIIEDLVEKKIDPYSLAEQLMAEEFNHPMDPTIKKRRMSL
jgi:putative protein kinase ArgK-like GTPase of G3E family